MTLGVCEVGHDAVVEIVDGGDARRMLHEERAHGVDDDGAGVEKTDAVNGGHGSSSIQTPCKIMHGCGELHPIVA